MILPTMPYVEQPDCSPERGRQLVRAGIARPDTMCEAVAVGRYYEQQRARVAQRGECSGRCNCEMVHHTLGHQVCPNTYEPCPSVRLSRIIDLFSILFQPKESV